MPDYKKVRKIEKIYAIEQGCTRPAVVTLDNGQKAILKYPQNPQGTIVLINEFIAYSVLETIGLSSPGFGIAVVGEDTILSDKVAASHQLDTFMGVGFYCEYVSSAVKASLGVLKCVENLDESCRIILFDAIVKNSDRHAANVIVKATMSRAKMYVIDHSHALGDPTWDCNSLSLNDGDSPYIWQENRDFYDMLIRAGAPASSSDFEDAIAWIRERVSGESLERILREIPVEWISEVGQEALQHAKSYILERVENLERIHNMIIRERGV